MAVFVIIIVIKKAKRRKNALCPCLRLVRSHTHDSHLCNATWRHSFTFL